MKSLCAAGMCTAARTLSKSSRLPRNLRPSVSTEMALAPPSRTRGPALAGSGCRTGSAWTGDAVSSDHGDAVGAATIVSRQSAGAASAFFTSSSDTVSSRARGPPALLPVRPATWSSAVGVRSCATLGHVLCDCRTRHHSGLSSSLVRIATEPGAANKRKIAMNIGPYGTGLIFH